MNTIETMTTELTETMAAKAAIEYRSPEYCALSDRETELILALRAAHGVPPATCHWPVHARVTDVGQPTLADGGRR